MTWKRTFFIAAVIGTMFTLAALLSMLTHARRAMPEEVARDAGPAR